MNLKLYTSVAKRLILKVRKFWGLVPTFLEVPGGKTGRGSLFAFLPPTSWIRLILHISNFWYQTSASRIKSATEGYSTTKFCIFKLVYIPNLSLNWQFNFFDQICPTKYFQSKTEKVDISNEFCIFKSVLVTNFS